MNDIDETKDLHRDTWKDYQRKKKDYNKQKIVVSEDTLLGWKKSLEMVSEDILWREKQKTIKEKGSGEWGHLLRKKKTTTNKR